MVPSLDPRGLLNAEGTLPLTVYYEYLCISLAQLNTHPGGLEVCSVHCGSPVPWLRA